MGQAETNSIPINERAEPESSGSGLSFFDSAPTHVGRKRRCRDMSGLSLCLCGESARPNDVGSIQCQGNGCETDWVSNCVKFASSGLKRLSTISGVLGMRIKDQDAGLVWHAH